MQQTLIQESQQQRKPAERYYEESTSYQESIPNTQRWQEEDIVTQTSASAINNSGRYYILNVSSSSKDVLKKFGCTYDSNVLEWYNTDLAKIREAAREAAPAARHRKIILTESIGPDAQDQGGDNRYYILRYPHSLKESLEELGFRWEFGVGLYHTNLATARKAVKMIAASSECNYMVMLVRRIPT